MGADGLDGGSPRGLPAVIGRIATAAVVALCVAGCGSTSSTSSTSTTGGDTTSTSTTSSSMPAILQKVPFLSSKGEKATLISELKPGPYQKSPLAIGEAKDLARQRGEGLGFVRSAPLEQYLNAVRTKLLASSGITDVPGHVMILASSSFQALSTPDGNVYVSMGCLDSLENGDEVAAILAHELSHILLAHHTSDLISGMQKRGQLLYEIGVSAKTALSANKTTSKSASHNIANEQLVGDVTDKLAMPAWGRRQEREADLLGIDLLIRAGYSPGAMVSVLEKLQAWEKQTGGSEDAYWARLKQSALSNPGEAMKMVSQRGLEMVSVSHPKTEDRISDSAEYLDHHYGDLKPRELQVTSWKALKARPDVAQVMAHYHLAFKAKGLLDKGDTRDAYASAKQSATAPTATDAYPNWVVYRSAAAIGHNQEAVDALRRAITSPEPVPQTYDDLILYYENTGNITTALQWTDRASAAFGNTPRWMPTKIRLLRKAGRTSEAQALTLNCELNAPELKRQCQSANQTTAGRASH